MSCWRFSVVAPIAKTNMSEVFRAVDGESDQPVAIKVAASHHASIAENLVREMTLLREHRHPGVVRIVADGVHEARPWYAMPWLQHSPFGAARARTITERDGVLREDHAEWSVAHSATAKASDDVDIDMLRHVCDTLAWLHSRGVVHRDIKPQNILFDDHGYPVLIDFGAAARTADHAGRDQLSFELGRIGTRGYMAPEQRWGERVDARTDLYAIGCMLFEALTREPFYETAHDARSLRPSAIRPDIRPGYDDLVARLLAAEPRDRLAFAADVARELERLGAAPARADLPAPQPYLHRSDLVGRACWLDRADQAHQRAAAGEGPIIVLVGASGCGKTRLAQGIVARERRRNRHVIISRCSETGGVSRLLHGLSPLLHRVALRCHADGPERTGQLLPPKAHLLVDAQPLLAGLVATPEEEPWRAMRPELTAEQVRAAALAVLHSYAQLTEPLIVIDDIHWADELTLAVLEELAMRPELAPHATILLTMRSEEPFADFERFRRSERVQTWPLDVLDEQAVVTMIGGMTAVMPPPSGLADAVVRDCAGNPLFVVSYLRQAIHSGALWREDGSWRFNVEGTLGMPRTLDGLLIRRLEQLGEPSIRLLDAMAVLGRQFDWNAAMVLSDIDLHAFAAAKVELTMRHILDETAEGELWFSHDKLHEYCYRGIEPKRLMTLHARTVDLLHGASHAERARHMHLGGRTGEAWPEFLAAADDALEQGRPALARRMLAAARSLNAGLSEDERALLLSGRAAFAARDYRACGRIAQSGLAALGVPTPTSAFGWGFDLASGALRLALRRSPFVGGTSSRQPRGRRASTIAYLYFLLGFDHQHHNRFLEQLSCTLASAFWAERGDDWGEASNQAATIALVLGFVGLTTLAEDWFDRARQWARQSGDPVRELQCYTMQAGLLAFHVEWERAEQAALLARSRCADQATREQLAYNAYTCATIMWLTGRMPDARGYADEMVRHSRYGDLQQTVGEGRMLIAAMLLQDGELDSAEHEALEAAEMLEQSGELTVHASCLAVAAAAALRRGAWDEALRRSQSLQQQLRDGGAGSFLMFTVHQLFPDVLLALAARHSGALQSELFERAAQAITACARLARNVWFLRPTALRQRGCWLLAQENSWRGKRKLERAVALARASGMPYEEAEALRAIACSEAFSRWRRDRAAARARTLFAQLGCRWHLVQLERGRSELLRRSQ